jgi:hypothetical protein
MIRFMDRFTGRFRIHNIGVDICDKWAHEPGRIALIYEDHKGQVTKYSSRI